MKYRNSVKSSNGRSMAPMVPNRVTAIAMFFPLIFPDRLSLDTPAE